MKTIQEKIRWYQFEDAKKAVLEVVLVHSLMAVIMLIPNFPANLDMIQVQCCLWTSLIVGFLYYGYHWESSSVNVMIGMGYLVSVFVEFLVNGRPSLPLSYEGYTIFQGHYDGCLNLDTS